MADVCSYSLLPTRACSHCAPPDATEQLPTSSRPFTARYPGTCAGCGFDIKPGEHVEYAADALTHVRCAHG